MLGGDQLGARGFAISARGRVVVVASLLSWCCANKNLCREEIYAATTQGKISLQNLPRAKSVNKINNSKNYSH